MINIAKVLRELADKIDKEQIVVENFDLNDEVVDVSEVLKGKRKYIKTGISDLYITFRS